MVSAHPWAIIETHRFRPESNVSPSPISLFDFHFSLFQFPFSLLFSVPLYLRGLLLFPFLL